MQSWIHCTVPSIVFANWKLRVAMFTYEKRPTPTRPNKENSYASDCNRGYRTWIVQLNNGNDSLFRQNAKFNDFPLQWQSPPHSLPPLMTYNSNISRIVPAGPKCWLQLTIILSYCTNALRWIAFCFFYNASFMMDENGMTLLTENEMKWVILFKGWWYVGTIQNL